MSISFGNNWTKLIIASLLMCFVFVFSALAQTDAKAPLDDDAVSSLVDELKEGIPGLIDDEEKVTAITDKWDAREDLAGKTKEQILNLLFEDVKSVVKDNEIQGNIWKNWTGKEKSNDGNQAKKPQAPTLPVETPEKPITPVSQPINKQTTEPTGTLTGTVEFYNRIKGYGFIKFIKGDGTSEEIFIHVTRVLDQTITANDRVFFEVIDGKKGRNAINVRKIK